MRHLDSRSQRELYDAAIGGIGSEVVYNGRRCVIVGRYYRPRTRMILYDVRETSDDSRTVTVHPKVPQTDLVRAR